MMRTVALSFFLFVCFLPLNQAGGTEAPANTLAPYFHIATEAAEVDSFPLKKTEARVQINGVIAEVVISQTYGNQGQHPINARYIFPAGSRAAVHGMRITIGETVVNARISKRLEAREEFKKAKSEGKSAGLLEQQRPNVFSMEVANILPGDEVTVTMRYTEVLVPAEGTYEFVFPTVVGPRYGGPPGSSPPEEAAWIHNPYLKQGRPPANEFDLQVALSAGMPIAAVSCPSHKTITHWEDRASAVIRLDPVERSGGDRDFILNYRLADSEVPPG